MKKPKKEKPNHCVCSTKHMFMQPKCQICNKFIRKKLVKTYVGKLPNYNASLTINSPRVSCRITSVIDPMGMRP